MATNSMLQVRLSQTLRDRLEAEASRKGLRPGELVRSLISASCGPKETIISDK
jgi:hypothetical protein